jgi:putative peptide zinc metalloprotease protein
VAAAAMALAIPVPWHLESSFVVEPLDAQSVYNLTPGYLQRFEVQPGDDVEAGQVLAWLSNPELEDERLRLLNQIEVQQIDVNLQRALDAQMQLELSQQRLDNLAAQLQDLEARIGDLCIRAPIAGRVIEAPRQDAPDIDDLKRGLPIWYGVPTESRNAGAFFEERTHLLTIAPRAAAEAVLLVDQSNRNFMREELPVELKFEHLPARTYDGTISSIAERHSEYAPQAMSNKLGGSESTVTDEQGREKLASTAYHAMVELPEDPELLVPGLRGKARITVVERTVGDWAWRYLRQTLHFKL